MLDSLAEHAAIVGMPLSRYVAALLTEAARSGPRPALRWADGHDRPDPDGTDPGSSPSGGRAQPDGEAVVVSLSHARIRRGRAPLRSYPPASARGPDTG